MQIHVNIYSCMSFCTPAYHCVFTYSRMPLCTPISHILTQSCWYGFLCVIIYSCMSSFHVIMYSYKSYTHTVMLVWILMCHYILMYVTLSCHCVLLCVTASVHVCVVCCCMPQNASIYYFSFSAQCTYFIHIKYL